MVPPTSIDSMNILESLSSELSSDWPPHRYSLGFPSCCAGYRRQFVTCLLTRFRKATSAFTLPGSDLRASGWRVLTQRPPCPCGRGCWGLRGQVLLSQHDPPERGKNRQQKTAYIPFYDFISVRHRFSLSIGTIGKGGAWMNYFRKHINQSWHIIKNDLATLRNKFCFLKYSSMSTRILSQKILHVFKLIVVG